MQPTTNGSAKHALGTKATAIGGGREAAAALWQAHRRWIAAVILAYKPRGADLEDLLQEVAMTLVAKIDTLRDQANVRAWLRVVAVNAARAAGRSDRAKPALRIAPDDLDRTVAAAAPVAGLDDHAQRVLELAQALPEGYREPLMLKAVHGMRTRQIAAILGIPEATVDTRVSRARRMLREQAQQCSNPASDERVTARAIE